MCKLQTKQLQKIMFWNIFIWCQKCFVFLSEFLKFSLSQKVHNSYTTSKCRSVCIKDSFVCCLCYKYEFGFVYIHNVCTIYILLWMDKY